MFQSHKIATCCYCGTRAALILDAGHHGLQCTSCGAPIRNLRHLPRSDEPPAGRKPGKGGDKGMAKAKAKGPGKLRKRAKKKVRSLMGEVFDGLDDLFD